jgi:hypothetical protein
LAREKTEKGRRKERGRKRRGEKTVPCQLRMLN